MASPVITAMKDELFGLIKNFASFFDTVIARKYIINADKKTFDKFTCDISLMLEKVFSMVFPPYTELPQYNAPLSVDFKYIDDHLALIKDSLLRQFELLYDNFISKFSTSDFLSNISSRLDSIDCKLHPVNTSNHSCMTLPQETNLPSDILSSIDARVESLNTHHPGTSEDLSSLTCPKVNDSCAPMSSRPPAAPTVISEPSSTVFYRPKAPLAKSRLPSRNKMTDIVIGTGRNSTLRSIPPTSGFTRKKRLLVSKLTTDAQISDIISNIAYLNINGRCAKIATRNSKLYSSFVLEVGFSDFDIIFNPAL